MNILDIEVPLIAAVNGPVRLHSEYILLADIVLATPSTVFQDKPHFELGVASGDGVHLSWQEAIGSIRGRYFIMTRQELDAQTAKEWGAVNEIVRPTSRSPVPARSRRARQASVAYHEVYAHRDDPEAAPQTVPGGQASSVHAPDDRPSRRPPCRAGKEAACEELQHLAAPQLLRRRRPFRPRRCHPRTWNLRSWRYSRSPSSVASCSGRLPDADSNATITYGTSLPGAGTVHGHQSRQLDTVATSAHPKRAIDDTCRHGRGARPFYPVLEQLVVPLGAATSCGTGRWDRSSHPDPLPKMAYPRSRRCGDGTPTRRPRPEAIRPSFSRFDHTRQLRPTCRTTIHLRCRLLMRSLSWTLCGQPDVARRTAQFLSPDSNAY